MTLCHANVLTIAVKDASLGMRNVSEQADEATGMKSRAARIQAETR